MPRKALIALATAATTATLCAPASAQRCGDRECIADVSISGHAEPQPIRRGEVSEYKFTASNNGEEGALALDLQATIPAGLTILGVRHYGGRSCSRKGTFVRCDLGDFASQQIAVVRVKVRGARLGTHIARAKVYSSGVNDPNGGNNQVSATLMVQRSASPPAVLRLADPQRILKTGGIRLRATPDRSGRLRARGEVRTPHGRVQLTSVSVRQTAGEQARLFLGTTPVALGRIRSALRQRSRLRVIVWVTAPSGTVRRELHVKR